jgi:hypothetical protein
MFLTWFLTRNLNLKEFKKESQIKNIFVYLQNHQIQLLLKKKKEKENINS